MARGTLFPELSVSAGSRLAVGPARGLAVCGVFLSLQAAHVLQLSGRKAASKAFTGGVRSEVKRMELFLIRQLHNGVQLDFYQIVVL